MAVAAGIDLGGTKIETRVFADDWSVLDTRRTATPDGYDALVAEVLDHLKWARTARSDIAVGVGSPGFVDRVTGTMTTANLPATGRPLPSDISEAFGAPVTFVNDCRAFTLSEAVLGAGQGARSVMGLVMGTGLAGGLAVNGVLLPDLNGIAGEYGHTPLSAEVVAKHNLPLLTCGCGRTGCVETLAAGPGIVRLAQHLGHDARDTRTIFTDPSCAPVLDVWAEIMGALIAALMATIDPDRIVLGGGVSNMPDVTGRLARATDQTLLRGSRSPEFRIAQGGPESGARGAALAALEASRG
ncbi:MAG: ROK family protein [Rhodobacteraceae bacterium]|nr:ROK family protein [Paracoccaceae bacterium]